MEVKKPEYVSKVWGMEEIIVNNSKYCGKRLDLQQGYMCSIHSHPKTETFYIDSGMVYLELENREGVMEGRILNPRDIVDIPPEIFHRFSGLEDSIIIEFSTPDTESERKTQSSKIPDFENWEKAILEKYGGNLYGKKN